MGINYINILLSCTQTCYHEQSGGWVGRDRDQGWDQMMDMMRPEEVGPQDGPDDEIRGLFPVSGCKINGSITSQLNLKLRAKGLQALP